jgi:alkylhydroperoxidase/carboxymuconolactone decarboxylase family protein YurZ
MHTLSNAHKIGDGQSAKDITQIVDYKVTMLIAAGAAMAANCEPCLNKIIPDLIESGVAEADIQKAVEIGQFVKDKPAAIMKEAADALAGTCLSGQHNSEGCPSDNMKPANGCCA